MKLIAITLSLFFFAHSVLAAKSVKVFSKEEALTETNFSKPRIYIQNTGDEAITDFVYKYKFSSQSGKTPVVEDFYTPNASIALVALGNDEYVVMYDFSGTTLNIGQVLPNMEGNVVGIHNSDWSAIDKSDDISNSNSTTFIENENISVYTSAGVLIYGIDSETTNKLPVAIAGEDIVVKDDGTGSQSIYFNGRGSYDPDGLIMSYNWSIDGKPSVQGGEGSMIVAVGCYTMTLTVTDDRGAVSTDEIIVNVIDNSISGFDLDVYSRESSPTETNIAKPRVYIKNNGDKAVEGFYYCYYINSTNIDAVIAEDWYTPNSNISIEKLTDEIYMIKYDFSDVTLNPGQVLPNGDGNSIGIHYDNWSEYDKSDDFSFVNSEAFVINENIAVYDLNNVLIYGNSPIETISDEVDVTIETEDVDNNPLGYMTMKVKITNNSGLPLNLAGKQVYYYFTDATQTLALTLSGYTLDGNDANDNYLDGDISIRDENSAVRVDIAAGSIAAYGSAEFTITVSRTTGNFDENDDYSYIMSSSYSENDKVVLVDGTNMETLYGTSPNNASVYGIYDLRISPNPAPASTDKVKLLFDELPEGDYQYYVYDGDGINILTHSINDVFIPTSLFTANEIYTVKLLESGSIVGITTFMLLD